MRVQQSFLIRLLSKSVFGLFLIVGAGAVLQLSEVSVYAQAAQQPIPATDAFNAPAACNDVDLGGLDINFGVFIRHVPNPRQADPEWKAIILDPNQQPNLQPPTILEGFVSPTPNDQTSTSQSTAEVAEEDFSWNHYTHDFTFKVLPDPGYQHLLSSWQRFPGANISHSGIPDSPLDYLFVLYCASLGGSVINRECVVPADGACPDGTTGTTCTHTDMEVEWDNASFMVENEGFQRIWGAVPEFVWPAVGDRVWVQGRWIFDCGHPNVPAADISRTYVKFSTEIHPPRALVTFRLNHLALDSFPVARTQLPSHISAPNFPAPQSYLPVTGAPVTLPPGVPNSGPTNVSVTEADIFASVNGGAANDLCAMVSVPCSGHTGPIIPVNDRNYVFDIYPPGTCYGPAAFCNPPGNGTFAVGPPVPDASLQWRIIDHFSELPAHACGGNDNTVCATVDPIICLIDASTPPPDQSETGCPIVLFPRTVPAHPTRLRVILPFAGTNANFFAKSILLGWDDVPAPPATPAVRTFQVGLKTFRIIKNGTGAFGGNGDWRVFVNVGGQWRYMSSVFDTDANNGKGIFQLDGGSTVCNGGDGDALTNNSDDNCFRFNNTPWTVSVQDGIPIHVAVGGFVARGLEHSGSDELFLCRNYPGGCDSPTDFSPLAEPWRNLATNNDDRIGTYEFDLGGTDYSPPPPFRTTEFDCDIFLTVGCHVQYEVEFTVQEVPPATAPVSAALQIGDPHFGQFITSATPVVLSSASADAEGFQYRFHLPAVDAPLPTYPFTPMQPFPVHWTHADLPAGAQSVLVFPPVSLNTFHPADGPYVFQYSAESFGNLLEPRHAAAVTLDNTPPVTTFVQPQPTAYVHSATLTLSYDVSDGTGSGVASASVTPTMDGSLTLPDGKGLGNGQIISLLMDGLTVGTHTFSVKAADNLGNTGSKSVTFTIIVTAQSIKDDVTQFLAAGKITQGEGTSLLSKLTSAAKARAAGNCPNAAMIYYSFISELKALSGKKIDPVAAAIMIADAQYLIAHCP